MHRILSFDDGPTPAVPLRDLRGKHPCEVVTCRDRRRLLEMVAERKPDAVIYRLGGEVQEDAGTLHLLRRLAPRVPLILLAHDSSLATQRRMQAFRPIYYGVCPMELEELEDAVRAALRQSQRRAS